MYSTVTLSGQTAEIVMLWQVVQGILCFVVESEPQNEKGGL